MIRSTSSSGTPGENNAFLGYAAHAFDVNLGIPRQNGENSLALEHSPFCRFPSDLTSNAKTRQKAEEGVVFAREMLERLHT